MKIILLILLSACTLLAAEYPRYKHRGPPYPPRAPNHQDFPNKRHQPPQYLQRGPPKGPKPPMPHLMPNYHKGPMGVPIGMPQAPPRAGSLPLRAFWKNGHVPMKFPQPEKVFLQQQVQQVQLQQVQLQQGQLQQVHQEKPFLSSPSISAQEYDYQIQTNNIPTSYVNPIKQIGEKGPIHTIPAPNLSPKDKPFMIEEARNEIYQQPFVIEEIRNEIHQQQQQQHQQQQQQHQQQQQLQQQHQQLQQQHQQQQQNAQYFKVEQSHQYQVTEQPEPSSNQNSYRLLQQQNQINQYQVQQQQQQQQKHQQQQQQLEQESLRQFQQQEYTPDEEAPSNQHFPQGDIILGNNLSPQDLYKLISTAYPQQQTQESSDQHQLFHPEPINVEQLQQDVASQLTSNKITFQPEFQSFNYDEQAHQKSLTKGELSSLVSAAYNLDPSDEAPEAEDQEPEAHSQQVVQNYFEKRSDVGNTEPEPAKQLDKKLPSFYSSLPNKEAAEKLAQLQAAGKVNSNLMKIGSVMAKSKEPMAIFIPDENAGGKEKSEGDDIRGDSEERSVEYDDYSQEEIASEEESEGYGHKLQPKKFD